MTEETTFGQLKKGLLELLRGYPSYRFFGKIEYYLKESRSSLKVLNEDGIIEFASKKESRELNKKLTPKEWESLKAEGKKEPVWYRLAPRGIDLAISMINLEYSEKMKGYSKQTLDYSKKMNGFTIAIIFLTMLTFGLGLLTFIIQLKNFIQ
ncbi:MAG: hypothetical protein QT05_C0026G0011 [archaeon GW2011_AR13]|nr:MAG: hypothetical protein QT05_C0026G0011 [archaeon GW2011_AR13]HIG95153.1 hypothetical protein [Nanoarchaeota archaeon]HIH63393.1 hypothetical protein [Nanoarchaeota archaeon]HIJ09844.1 hypothetical protein [Nanoarchaeota archaeon]